MTDESAAAIEVAPEDVAEGQVAGQTAEAEAPEVSEETAEDKKSRSQERRERRKAHEQRLLAEVETARKETEALKKQLDRKAALKGEAPKESDFDDVIQYSAALGAHKATEAVANRDQAEISGEIKERDDRIAEIEAQRLQERQADFQDQVQDARSRYADLDAVMAVAANANIVSPDLAAMVLEGESPVDVAYHLGKNPALARSLSQMPPLQAARELGRIEAGLSRPQPRTATNAPDPITPVRAGGSAGKDPAKMTADEYRAWRQAGGKP